MSNKIIHKTKFFLFNKLGNQISEKDKISNSNFGLNNQSNREIWLENRLSKIHPGMRILDAGAGELKYKKFCTHLDYVSQDFGQYNGLGNNLGLQTQTWDNSNLDIVSDITQIPEADSSFDAIMCIEVLEHLPSPVEALKELSRLLKKGGTLLITAPFCSLTHFAPFHYYSGFNKYFYEKHLGDLNFIVDEIIPNGNYFEYLAQEIQCRIPNSYSFNTLSGVEKEAISTVLKLLKRMSDEDKGSSELLCFGYHIKAQKK